MKQLRNGGYDLQGAKRGIREWRNATRLCLDRRCITRSEVFFRHFCWRLMSPFLFTQNKMGVLFWSLESLCQLRSYPCKQRVDGNSGAGFRLEPLTSSRSTCSTRPSSLLLSSDSRAALFFSSSACKRDGWRTFIRYFELSRSCI